jgi:hypothetical protein
MYGRLIVLYLGFSSSSGKSLCNAIKVQNSFSYIFVKRFNWSLALH